MKYVLSVLVVSLLSADAVFAQDGDTFLTAAEAGPDYEVQGEYVGEIGEGTERLHVGLQIIALGDHKFDTVAYPGGLPGAGWTMEEKHRGSGETKDGVTRFTAADSEFYALHQDGVVTLFAGDDVKVGTMKKVERTSPTMGAKPPEGAVVLFDGTSADAFERGQMTADKLLAADCETKARLGDHTLHLEFRTPFKPKARGQARGNSGVYLQGRYECQVLDSFGLEGENNECGGIYSIAKPAVNACFPPLTWQTYDIEFTAARYQGGKKVKNARTTIRHNGIVIHDDLELTHGTPGKSPEGEGPAALYLQGHGNPVVYRNIWMVAR